MMLTRIKHKIATYPLIDYDQLWEQLIEAEVVCFDVFNTLLKQNTPNNSDIFTLVAELWQQKHAQPLVDFKQHRLAAQQQARAKYGATYTLANVYEFLAVPPAVMDLEFQLVYQVQQANTPIQTLYNALRQAGKRIVIIADTNADKVTVASLLAQTGYIGYEKLYVSQEYGESFKNGRLFKKILQELALAPQQVLHVGDDWYHDYLASKEAHIRCYRIPKVVNNSYQPVIKNDVILKTMQLFCNNTLAQYEFDSYQEFGYSVFGPVILGFSQWLQHNVAADEKLFFLARDGFILQEAYQTLFPNQVTSYLHVSRQALQVPLLKDALSIEEVLEIINLPTEFTANQFLAACGLGFKTQIMDSDIKYRNEPQFYQHLEQLYQQHQTAIIANAQEEFMYLAQYLKAMNFTGKVAIIDIGWHGNKQRALQQFCHMAGISVEITGYYFGLAKSTNPSLKARGFWFDQLAQPTALNLAQSVHGIIEFLFSANHGSTRHYRQLNGEVVPVLAHYEFTGSHSLVIQGQLLKTIRQAALQFVADFGTSNLQSIIELTPQQAMKLFELKTFKPDKEFMRRFGHFEFIDRNVKYLVMPKGNWYYVFHPAKFKYDFFNSRWPIGFLKRIFKLPINYLAVYERLVKQFDISNN